MMIRIRLAIIILLISNSFIFSETPDYLKSVQYDTDLIPPDIYKSRRDSIMKMVGNDAAVIVFSAPERMRNADVEYSYRQDDNFYYLTGFTEPNSILMLSPKGVKVKIDDSITQVVNEILFVQSRDPQKETWTGRRYGEEGAEKLVGVQCAKTNDNFKKTFSSLLFSGIKFLFAPHIPSTSDEDLKELLNPLQNWIENSSQWNSKVELRDPSPMIRTMRIIKDKQEIALLKKATDISVAAHNQAMMSCEPDMYEYEIQAVYEYVFKKLGAEYVGYPCINGSGENSVILHYDSNRKQIHSGELVLSDCAAEYHGYSSDVTRTYPANGKFSKEQKEIYQIVLNTQKASITMMKAGVKWSDVTSLADSMIESGLFDLGIIKEKGKKNFKKFYMHGLGHAVGLNVHDIDQSILVSGMVHTVEPGIYIASGTEGVDSKYYNIGVRIEDVILITDSGNENLSAGAPREISEIESLMKKNGIGNRPIK